MVQGVSNIDVFSFTLNVAIIISEPNELQLNNVSIPRHCLDITITKQTKQVKPGIFATVKTLCYEEIIRRLNTGT